MEIKNITAICGWALPPNWFGEQIQLVFPNSRVKTLYPANPFCSESAKKALNDNPADLYIGYSLGSLWLFMHRQYLPSSALKAALAPILSFTHEGERGGKTPKTKLKYFLRLLERGLETGQAALKDFYTVCSAPFPDDRLNEVPQRSALIKGLEFLESALAPPASTKDFITVSGEKDIFLDSEILRRYIPGLLVEKAVGHSPGPLLKRLAIELNRRDFL